MSMSMGNVALCRCGIDMTEHGSGDGSDEELLMNGHVFVAAGTRHRCEEWLVGRVALCPRPRYHGEEGVECGFLTGELLW
jgi:hypothetical protein